MLIVMAMMKDGLSHAEACSKIWLIDSNGLLIKNRSDGGITGHKVQFAKDNPPMNKLNEIVRLVKPTVLIGNIPPFFALLPPFSDISCRPLRFLGEVELEVWVFYFPSLL